MSTGIIACFSINITNIKQFNLIINGSTDDQEDRTRREEEDRQTNTLRLRGHHLDHSKPEPEDCPRFAFQGRFACRGPSRRTVSGCALGLVCRDQCRGHRHEETARRRAGRFLARSRGPYLVRRVPETSPTRRAPDSAGQRQHLSTNRDPFRDAEWCPGRRERFGQQPVSSHRSLSPRHSLGPESRRLPRWPRNEAVPAGKGGHSLRQCRKGDVPALPLREERSNQSFERTRVNSRLSTRRYIPQKNEIF